jgi:PHD/YefM family antitoxin component YafN of YafNO toxin-antitoxin module
MNMVSAAQFVIDADGNKTAVILSIEEYEEMLEDLHLGRIARESKSEPQRPFLDVVEEMRSTGEIDV